MSFPRLSVLLLVAVFQWQAECYVVPTTARKCPPNSHYGIVTGCDLSCSRLNPGGYCTFHFYEGCRCDAGYIPQSGTTGLVCVKPEDCIAECNPNSHFDPRASNCQPTCIYPDAHLHCEEGFYPRCVCDEGYVLSDFTCVKKSECPVYTLQ